MRRKSKQQRNSMPELEFDPFHLSARFQDLMSDSEEEEEVDFDKETKRTGMDDLDSMAFDDQSDDWVWPTNKTSPVPAS